MEINVIIATLVGAFIFPFIIHLVWGKMVKEWGAIGGFMSALFIVGSTWALNHGYGLIGQSGDAWVDMGLAAGVGLFVATTVSGGNAKKGMPVVVYAIIGGIIGGFIASLV